MVALDESYPFDTSQIATEAQWRAIASNWQPDGVVPVPVSTISVTSSLAVAPNSGMVLNIGSGAVLLQGTIGRNTSTKTVTIAANSSGNPRIDLVVARLDTVLNTVSVEVKTGTPAATPASPTVTQTSATWEIPLAQVAVANSAVSITADNITDRRNLYAGLAPVEGNPFVNASMAVWQRGNSVTPTNGGYAADRWITYNRNDIVYSRQSSNDYQGSAYCMRIQRPNGNSTTTATGIHQSASSVDSLKFAGRLCCYSLRIRRGVGSTATVQAILYSGTGSDQTLGAGFTNSTAVTSAGITPSATWQTVAVTGTPGLTVTQLASSLTITWSGTAGANDYIEIKDVRCDEGDRPMPHVQPVFSDDVTQCHRYFWKIGSEATSLDTLGLGICTGTTTADVIIPMHTKMRAVPTLGVAGSFRCNDTGINAVVTNITMNTGTATPDVINLSITCSGGGLTLAKPCRLFADGSSGNSLSFSADI